MSLVRLCQFSPALVRGDAMSNQAVAIRRAAEALGLEAAMFQFGEGDHPAAHARLYQEYQPRPNDVIMLNYGGRRHYEDWVVRQPGRVFVYYHNVTPARFFERIEFPWVEALYRGRDALSDLAHLGGLAGSEYNQREMERAGFRDVRVIPYILDLDAFVQAATQPEALALVERHSQPDRVNWLHVGRLAPNKRIEDIVRAFYYYHAQIRRNSHLFIVGSDTGLEAYSHPLRQWVERLGLADAVTFVGYVSDAEVAGFFKLASVYVCMSEHEGFCIPLLEAMVHRVPIIAYRSTAVEYTLGSAGVMVDDKDPRLVAQIAHLLCDNPAYRQQVIADQLAQAQVWHPSKALKAFEDWIKTL
jgi:glycosyltransferase involved in cell wall biosynthesis